MNQVSDDVYGEKTLTSYLNPAAFARPAPGTLGELRQATAGRGRHSGTWTWRCRAIVSLGAGHTLEFRVEAFNLLNNFNWGNPVTNFGAGTFGRILTQAGAPRIMQFGVKYGF